MRTHPKIIVGAELAEVRDTPMPYDRTPITAIRVRALRVPLDKPHKTASGTVLEAPLVLLDVETKDGVVGRSYAFVYTAMALNAVAGLLRDIEPLLIGEPLAPLTINRKMEARFRLLGAQGIVGIAIATIDMALWDAAAKISNLPLAEYLGASRLPVMAYDSLGQMTPDETAREVEQSVARGFRAFKVKSGHLDPATDIKVVEAIRKVAGPEAWVAMDFNQAFPVSESIERLRALDGLGIAWIEEPARAEDLEGSRRVSRTFRTAVQLGENWWGPSEMAKSIAADASTLVMLDVMKIGGVTGWNQAAALAGVHRLPVSSHLFLEFSSHLLSATPNAHMIEFMDLAGPITHGGWALDEGMLRPRELPGAGIEWDEAAIARLS